MSGNGNKLLSNPVFGILIAIIAIAITFAARTSIAAVWILLAICALLLPSTVQSTMISAPRLFKFALTATIWLLLISLGMWLTKPVSTMAQEFLTYSRKFTSSFILYIIHSEPIHLLTVAVIAFVAGRYQAGKKFAENKLQSFREQALQPDDGMLDMKALAEDSIVELNEIINRLSQRLVRMRGIAQEATKSFDKVMSAAGRQQLRTVNKAASAIDEETIGIQEDATRLEKLAADYIRGTIGWMGYMDPNSVERTRLSELLTMMLSAVRDALPSIQNYQQILLNTPNIRELYT